MCASRENYDEVCLQPQEGRKDYVTGGLGEAGVRVFGRVVSRAGRLTFLLPVGHWKALRQLRTQANGGVAAVAAVAGGGDGVRSVQWW